MKRRGGQFQHSPKTTVSQPIQNKILLVVMQQSCPILIRKKVLLIIKAGKTSIYLIDIRIGWVMKMSK